MVLIWIEAWVGAMGAMGVKPRREPQRQLQPQPQARRSAARVEPSWQVPAWRRRALPARQAGATTPVAGSPPVRRRCWVRVDPRDRGHAAMGGSFAEVCAALERLAAIEDARGC